MQQGVLVFRVCSMYIQKRNDTELYYDISERTDIEETFEIITHCVNIMNV